MAGKVDIKRSADNAFTLTFSDLDADNLKKWKEDILKAVPLKEGVSIEVSGLTVVITDKRAVPEIFSETETFLKRLQTAKRAGPIEGAVGLTADDLEKTYSKSVESKQETFTAPKMKTTETPLAQQFNDYIRNINKTVKSMFDYGEVKAYQDFAKQEAQLNKVEATFYKLLKETLKNDGCDFDVPNANREYNKIFMGIKSELKNMKDLNELDQNNPEISSALGKRGIDVLAEKFAEKISEMSKEQPKPAAGISPSGT